MDPSNLVGPSSPLGYPAPYWFLLFFKVLGFILHMLPMHIWLAGMVAAMFMRRYGGAHARRLGGRLISQMPVLIAAGVNLGIVPLLFTQVAYYRAFYPATILMGWFWFSVIFLLGVAYYGVYLNVLGLRGTAGWFKPYTGFAGWLSAILFIFIGFIFANALSLMANVGAWQGLWEHTNVAGAPLGIALNTADPTFFPRWLMHFGLAFTTLAAYMVFDAAVFAGKESPEYRAAVPLIALKTGSAGLVLYAAFGAAYFMGALPKATQAYMLGGWHGWLVVLTAASVGLPWLLLMLQLRGPRLPLAIGALVLQVVALALNAVSRQIVQNVELKPYMDVASELVHTQWDTLILFLVLFVAGLGVLFWMVAKVVQANRRAPHPAPAGKKR
jgi:hypothetical protein